MEPKQINFEDLKRVELNGEKFLVCVCGWSDFMIKQDPDYERGLIIECKQCAAYCEIDLD